MNKVRVGDRFRGKGQGEIWEIVEVLPGVRAKGVVLDPADSPSYYKGYTATYVHWHHICEYLGNFGKSTSFNSLYEKLNNS